MFSVIVIFLLIYFPQGQQAVIRHPYQDLTIIQFIQKSGYPVETHSIETEDGYILTTYRIPHGQKSNKPNDKVILLVHGMAGAAENYLLLGPNDALGFILADRGFDVWLFNARGNFHSRKHKTLNAYFLQKGGFWDFSWHELGMYDLPANIDYILRKTKKSSLFYVGHSQGCTSYFVLTSERPEYNSKIKVGAMLAPPIIMTHIEHSWLRLISKFHTALENIIYMFNYYELVIPNSPMLNGLLKNLCTQSQDFLAACADAVNFIAGLDSGLMNVTSLPFYINSTPSGFAARQMLHYIQEMKSGHFRKYDFGTKGNLAKYNTKIPPDYHLNNSVAPVGLFFGNGDFLASISAMEVLPKIIPNVVMNYEVPYNKFNHLDFLVAYNAKELLYEKLYDLLMRYEK